MLSCYQVGNADQEEGEQVFDFDKFMAELAYQLGTSDLTIEERGDVLLMVAKSLENFRENN